MPGASSPSFPGFSHRIEVDKNLIRLLSEHTYTSFTSCIRELVVNAYDADATRVAIDVDLSAPPHAGYAGSLTITDNGHGMSADDFLRYTRIAPGGLPRERSQTFGRLRVGKFGIGYLAAFPFCEVLEIKTSTGGGEEILATFRCTDYFRDAGKFQPIEDIPVEAKLEQRRSPELQYRSGTRLELRGLSREVRSYLGTPPLREDRRIPSILDWEGLKRLEWELGQVLPIRWQKKYEGWHRLLGIVRPEGDPGLEVYLNKKRVEKPWPTTAHESHSLTKEYPRDEGLDFQIAPPRVLKQRQAGAPTGGDASYLYRYLVVTPHGPITPLEFRGIQLRLRGVGLGLPITYRDLGLPKDNELVRYLVEVHLVGGFDEQITLDRTQLKKTPWFYTLLHDLEDSLLGIVRQRGNTESRLQRDIQIVRKLSSGGAIEPIGRTLASIQRHAEEMDYQVERREIPPEDSTIDHEQHLVILPAASPRPTLRISEDRSLEIVEGKSTDTTLRSEWVRIKQSRLEVSPELRELGISPHRYRQLLQRLANIEWRRTDAVRSKSPEVQQAINSLACQIKTDLVKMERR